jgi:hypothetical protein
MVLGMGLRNGMWTITQRHFQAKGRITAEEREKFVLIFLSFNGQLDSVLILY